MLQAQLRGKLTRKEEDMEDLLTSDVFGSLKYVEPLEALMPLLCRSIDQYEKPLNLSLSSTTSGDISYEFWPRLEESGCKECEPDVCINIRFAGKPTIMILVEAKYLSGKSSESDGGKAPMDQLAREWDNLRCLADRKKAIPILLYVTADTDYPRDDVTKSCAEFEDKRKGCMKVYWVSWREIPKILSSSNRAILIDLVQVLRRLGLTFFEGINAQNPISIKWSFKATADWDWAIYKKYHICWKFGEPKLFNWKTQIKSIKWRFANGK